MSTHSLTAHPIQRQGVWRRQTETEVALYDPDNGKVHLLNDTALAIWDLCDGTTTPEEMIEAICELFRMHRDVVAEDVRRTLEEFDRAGLVGWND
jgi:PqqD family protein of HPr-rel-A system